MKTRRSGASRRAAATSASRSVAHRVAHDEQVLAHDDAVAIAIGRHVHEVVDHDQVTRVEQVVQTADAGVRQDAVHAGAMKHAEHLPRGAAPRHTLAPAVHGHVQDIVSAEREQGERRTLAPGRLEHELSLEHASVRVQIAGQIGGQRPGAADDGARRGRYVARRHSYRPARSGVTRSATSWR